MSEKEKELSFSISITGVSQEAAELSKLEIQLQNLKKVRADLIRQASAPGHIASNEEKMKLAAVTREITEQTNRHKELKKVLDSAPDSLIRMRAKLIDLKNEYAAGSEAVRAQMVPQINALTDKVTKAENAIQVHSRGVGSYKKNILDAAKEVLGFASVAALATTAVSKMKEAFLETEIGARTVKQWGEALRTYFQNVIGGNIQMAGTNALAAAEIAKKMDELRQGDREDLIIIAKLEGELNDLRRAGADVTLSVTEQLKYQNLASEKENELLQFKIKDKQEELDLINQMIAVRPNDTKLLDQQAQLQAQIINLQHDQSLRIASKRSALREKEINEQEKKKKEAEKIAAEVLELERENAKQIEKFYAEKWANIIKGEESFSEKVKKVLGIKNKDLGLQVNEEIMQANREGYKKAQADETAATKEGEAQRAQIREAAMQGIQTGITEGFNFKRSKLQAEMEAELSNKNLTEQQKIAIQKKYAKQQQKLDVQSAIINGALAVGNALATVKPFIPAGIIAGALAAVQTGLQVATIKAQKYAVGGYTGEGGKYEPAGIVHKGEWIATQEMVDSPVTGPIISNLERMRLTMGGSGAVAKAKTGPFGYASGGYVQQLPTAMAPMVIDYDRLELMMRENLNLTLSTHKVISGIKEVRMITDPQRI
jgi:hypothetical protein